MTPLKTVTFGELLLRLSPPGYERILQSPLLHAYFGGAEANVAVGLAQLGLHSTFVTRLPANAVGDAGLRVLRAENVDVGGVERGGQRVGVYFAEPGIAQRMASVIYDRAHSALSELGPETFDWTRLLRGAAWFHSSGITPALGPGAAACTRSALVAARHAGATVSIDLNYRRKLWSEQEAQRVMRPLMRDVNWIIGNEEHLKITLGVSCAGPTGRPDLDSYRAAGERVVSEYGVEGVAITVRGSHSATENRWTALLYHGPSKTLHEGHRYVVRLVERIGGGDAFAAGLIFALLDRRPLPAALRFALCASVLKHTIPGDFNHVSLAEIEQLSAGDESGRIQR
jgi:2-dehydro-3-deoxygluconokinase